MNQVQKIQLEGIAVHEGAPGHHFQIARAQELPDLPKSRRFGGYSAYSEGWGLYTERLAKEMGGYTDPYSEFGMLSLQMWRAIRLVTDTGLHSKRWSREKAIDYFRANSSLSPLDIEREVNRYINNPGQATSYMIGQRKIAELRKRAEDVAGPQVRHSRLSRGRAWQWRGAAERAGRGSRSLHRGQAELAPRGGA